MKGLDFIKLFLTAAFCLFFSCSDGDNSENNNNNGNHQATYYTVSFDTQGGKNISPVSAKSGDKITLPLPEKTGFSFDGWYSSSSGGAFYGNNGDIHTVTGNVTMYARWTDIVEIVEPNSYTITFDARGGSSVSSITAAYGSNVTLPATTQSGYTFNGWYSSSSGGTRYGGGGSSYTIAGNVTMYAQWTQIGGGIPNLGVNGSGGDGDVMTINGIECVLVKAGTFIMGSPESEEGRGSDEVQHQVILTQDYWISKYEITNAQYGKFLFGKENYPVVDVDWFAADDFAKSIGGRLPTEAEWEFAARGGNKSKGYIYSGSNNLDEVGWYEDNSEDGIKPVGQKLPNELGIYDMSGNVREWCNDWYRSYVAGPVTNPSYYDIPSGDDRVERGGGWYYRARNCRVASRDAYSPSGRYNHLGFRVVFPRS